MSADTRRRIALLGRHHFAVAARTAGGEVEAAIRVASDGLALRCRAPRPRTFASRRDREPSHASSPSIDPLPHRLQPLVSSEQLASHASTPPRNPSLRHVLPAEIGAVARLARGPRPRRRTSGIVDPSDYRSSVMSPSVAVGCVGRHAQPRVLRRRPIAVSTLGRAARVRKAAVSGLLAGPRLIEPTAGRIAVALVRRHLAAARTDTRCSDREHGDPRRAHPPDGGHRPRVPRRVRTQEASELAHERARSADEEPKSTDPRHWPCEREPSVREASTLIRKHHPPGPCPRDPRVRAFCRRALPRVR